MAIKETEVKRIFKSIGLLTERQIKDALDLQKKTRERIGLILVRQGYISNEKMSDILAPQLGIVPEQISNIKIPTGVINAVPLVLAHHHRIIPLEHSNDTLKIATDNPFNLLALENLKNFLNVPNIDAILTTEDELGVCLSRYYGLKGEQPISTVIETFRKSTASSVEGLKKEEKPISDEEAPVVKLVSLIITEAFHNRASDIHVEPLEHRFRIRYRVDGVLHEVPGPPKRLQNAVISRIKIMAGMDIAEHRLPQDGRIRLTAAGRDLDLRVSTLPGIYGESVVLRILDKTSFLLGLGELGFMTEDQKIFEQLIKMPNGIFLITGPTGSGKTTTLYAALSCINKPDRKLVTVEDPVEYQIMGINQVQVKPQIGLTFASGLRSILRQAPDIVMVGEIRDLETSQIAIQAALTGHLVFSTLHTNDAAGAITRLIDMGVKPYLVSSAVQAVMAQRLVRKVCPHCKKPYKPTKEERQVLNIGEEDLKAATFYLGKGCKQCNNTGYRGRIGIFELLVINDKIRQLIFQEAPSSAIKEKAREFGLKTLRDDGKRKALMGMTTIPEIVRATQVDTEKETTEGG